MRGTIRTHFEGVVSDGWLGGHVWHGKREVRTVRDGVTLIAWRREDEIFEVGENEFDTALPMPPRPMLGLKAVLTEEQIAAVLSCEEVP